MATKDAAQEVLAREILDEGLRRAEQVRSDARNEADKIAAHALARAEAEASKIASDAEARAARKTQMIMATIPQELAQHRLRARADLAQEAIESARKKAKNLDGAAYRNAVWALATDALRRMPGGQFVVRAFGLNDAECAALRDGLLEALRAEGRIVDIQCVPGDRGSRGVIVESGDGRLRWDNTFEARLNRMKGGLQRLIAPVLFGET